MMVNIDKMSSESKTGNFTNQNKTKRFVTYHDNNRLGRTRIQNMILGKYAAGKSGGEYFERAANIEIGREMKF